MVSDLIVEAMSTAIAYSISYSISDPIQLNSAVCYRVVRKSKPLYPFCSIFDFDRV